MKTHIRLFVIAIICIFPVAIFAHTKEEVDREIRRGGDIWQKELMDAALKVPGVSRGRQSTLFEDQFTDPCISRMFLNGNYCNDAFSMQNKLRAWQRKWLLEGPEEFCALGMKGVKVWHYNKKDRAILIKKYGGGARPNFLYGVKYIGKWTEKDQLKLERQLDAQERIYLHQLKIEERKARKQVEQWPAEWEQKEKEFLDGSREKEHKEWLRERNNEMWNLKTKAGEGAGDPRYKSITPFERERLYFLHSKLVGGPYVPTPPFNWPRRPID